jgi:hypothetical protein
MGVFLEGVLDAFLSLLPAPDTPMIAYSHQPTRQGGALKMWGMMWGMMWVFFLGIGW